MISEIQKYLQSECPITVLKNWIQEAKNHKCIKEPTGMVLSTVLLPDGLSKEKEVIPFSRMVLVKEITEEGVIFYTNSQSQKGKHLDQNSYCSGLFYWDPLFKQISIIGRAKKIPRQQTENYWKTRLRESQLSQWISKQSEYVESREDLKIKLEQAREKWEGQEVECPMHWSGYHIDIQSIEFLLGHNHRLHDRFLFQKEGINKWNSKRLSP